MGGPAAGAPQSQEDHRTEKKDAVNEEFGAFEARQPEGTNGTAELHEGCPHYNGPYGDAEVPRDIYTPAIGTVDESIKTEGPERDQAKTDQGYELVIVDVGQQGDHKVGLPEGGQVQADKAEG